MLPYHSILISLIKNLQYTRGITPKRVTSGGFRLSGLAPGQHNSDKTSQWWRAASDTVSDLAGVGIERKLRSKAFNKITKTRNS